MVSDQFLINQNKHPKNYLIDYEQVPLTRNVRNSKSISRNAPILSGLFKNLPYQISKSEHGEVINSFCKDRSEKIERLGSIIRKLKNLGFKNLIFPKSSELDLKNSELVFNWFKKNKPDIVIFAAAKVGGIFANNSYPVDFLLDNLKIQNNVKKLISGRSIFIKNHSKMI